MMSTGKCMKKSPPTAATRWRIVGRSKLERIEGSEALHDREIDRNDDDRHDGERRRERNVSGRALLLINHHADEVAGRTDDAGNDVVTERQRKREDRTRRDTRKRERQDDVAEGLPRFRAAIRRRLDQ